MSSAAQQQNARPRGRPRKDARTLLSPPPSFHHHQIFQQQQLRIPQHEDDHEEDDDQQLDQNHNQNHQHHQHHPHHHHHQQQHQQQQVVMSEADDEEELLVQQKKKEIKRSWREEWKVHHKWVYPITKENGELRLKCQWCTTYNMENVFAKEGCSTIQLSALNTHAKSEAHKTAESRWENSDDAAITTALTAVPANLWGFGAKESDGVGDGLEGPELNGGHSAAELNRKRKFANCGSNGGGFNKAAAAEGGGVLGSILQKNNSRMVEVLVEAESGRNRRHSVDVSLAKKQYALEEQRQRLDSERLEFDRARLESMLQLGQQYNAALTNIGTGLLKIGSALESTSNKI